MQAPIANLSLPHGCMCPAIRYDRACTEIVDRHVFNVGGVTYHVAQPRCYAQRAPLMDAARLVQEASGHVLAYERYADYRIEHYLHPFRRRQLGRESFRPFYVFATWSCGRLGRYVDCRATAELVSTTGSLTHCARCGQTGIGWWTKPICAGELHVDEPLCDHCGCEMDDAWQAANTKPCAVCERPTRPADAMPTRLKVVVCSHLCEQEARHRATVRSRAKDRRRRVERDLSKILSLETK